MSVQVSLRASQPISQDNSFDPTIFSVKHDFQRSSTRRSITRTMAFLLSIIINQLQTHQTQLHCLKCECWCVWERDIIHKSYFNHEKYLNRTVLTWDLLSKPLSKVQNTNEVPSPTRMSLKSAKCSSFRKKGTEG